MKAVFGKVVEKRSEFEEKWRELEAKSNHWLIRVSIHLVKHARMEKVLRGFIEQSVTVFDGFVSRVGGELVE